MKHAPLPRVILHAIGIQLDWCWFTSRFYFRGYSDQYQPHVGSHCIPFTKFVHC